MNFKAFAPNSEVLVMAKRSFPIAVLVAAAFTAACNQQTIDGAEASTGVEDEAPEIMPGLGGIASSNAKAFTAVSVGAPEPSSVMIVRDEDVLRVTSVRSEHAVSIAAQHAEDDDVASAMGFGLDEDLAFGRDGIVTLTIIDAESGELVAAQTERALTREPVSVVVEAREIIAIVEDSEASGTLDVVITILDKGGTQRVERHSLKLPEDLGDAGEVRIAVDAAEGEAIVAKVGDTYAFSFELADAAMRAAQTEIEAKKTARDALRVERRRAGNATLTERIAWAAAELKTLRTAFAARVATLSASSVPDVSPPPP